MTNSPPHRPLVLASIMLGMFMAAIEGTIVATAMPSIVGDLGVFASFSWVFSAFLLMQAVTIPIYGKLADLFGRKPVFVVGVLIFLTGSLLCGLARTMSQLIIYRLVQGFGAGAVQPIATTIVGDIYTVEERGKIQGFLSSVWGISSVVGPAVGGVFVQYISWSWVFWVNLPIGVISIFGLVTFLHEKVERKKHRIDFTGALLLLIAVSSLMVALIRGGVDWPWGSVRIIGLFAVFVIGLLLFVLQERRASEPVMPLQFWQHRFIALCNLASLSTGILFIGISTFLPAYVQGVLGKTPTVAGFTLAMMSIGWPISAALGGRLMLRIGFRRLAVIGGFILIAGAVVFVLQKPAYGPVWSGFGSFLIGFGMGFASTAFIVGIQSAVGWEMRGAATAGNMFMRIVGTTIGASLLGGILNSRMKAFLSAHAAGGNVNLQTVNSILDPAARAKMPAKTLQLIQHGLASSTHTVYWVVLLLAVISLGLVTLLPRPKPQRSKQPETANEPG